MRICTFLGLLCLLTVVASAQDLLLVPMDEINRGIWASGGSNFFLTTTDSAPLAILSESSMTVSIDSVEMCRVTPLGHVTVNEGFTFEDCLRTIAFAYNRHGNAVFPVKGQSAYFRELSKVLP